MGIQHGISGTYLCPQDEIAVMGEVASRRGDGAVLVEGSSIWSRSRRKLGTRTHRNWSWLVLLLTNRARQQSRWVGYWCQGPLLGEVEADQREAVTERLVMSLAALVHSGLLE